jgi:hypothetical protein
LPIVQRRNNALDTQQRLSLASARSGTG